MALLEPLGGVMVEAVGSRDGFSGLPQTLAQALHTALDVEGLRLTIGGGPVAPAEAALGVESEQAVSVIVGEIDAEPSRSFPLCAAQRELGCLEIWSPEADATEHDWLLPMLPWIAIAIEIGESRQLIDRLLAMLSEDARDWERMEQQLERLVSAGRRALAERAQPSAWPSGPHEPVDLIEFFARLEAPLQARLGEHVQLEVRCEDTLWPVLSDSEQVERFVTDVADALRDLGSDRIGIETRALDDDGAIRAEIRTTAEIVITGRGGRLDPISRDRLRETLEGSDRGLLVADLDLHEGPEGVLAIRACLPLIAPGPGARTH